jgi:hypothetical protein
MATTLKIQRFIRSVRQGRTAAPVSCTAMSSCTQQAYDALLAASWAQVDEKEAGLPRHNWAQTGFSNRWDAAKYCGDYADGYQHGYATAVCYTLRMPADALAGTVAKIASVAIPVRGDRWLADGCDIAITLSASATPPVWGAAPGDSVTGQLAVVPSNTGTDSSETITFDWTAAPVTSLAYLHITLRLTDYLTHRGAWIEGGAMIDGANIAVTFDRDVAPDSDAGCPLVGVSGMAVQPDGTLLSSAGWDQAWVAAGLPVGYVPESTLAQAAEWSRVMTMFPGSALTYAEPSTRGGDFPIGAYLTLGPDGAPRMVGSTRILGAPHTDGRTMHTLAFDAPIPAPPDGMRAHIVVYALAAAAAAEYGLLDAATVADHEFWLGTSNTVSLGGVSIAAERLGILSVDSGIDAPSLPVSLLSTRPIIILLAMSLRRVCGSPGWVPGERYGITWSPNIITLS